MSNIAHITFPSRSYTFPNPDRYPDFDRGSVSEEVSPFSLEDYYEPEPPYQPPAILPPRKVGLAAQLADIENLKELATWFDRLKGGIPAYDTVNRSYWGNSYMSIHPESSYSAETGSRVTFATYIEKILGQPLPLDRLSFAKLVTWVNNSYVERSLATLGGLGGALSWPVPLSKDEQQRLLDLTLHQQHALGDKPSVKQTDGGVLEFLRYQHPIATQSEGSVLEFLRSLGTMPPQTVNFPAKILHVLLNTPQAQLMGKDLQEKMQGIATDSSATDYLLAAIALQLDPESITSPCRNKIAGFDLASEQHWGKPASTVVDSLAQWLVDKGKTTPEMSQVGAYVLLAKDAPVYLIKDIPDNVTYGSPAWVNLAVAAATIEARTPGRVPTMTFAEVMLEAESASKADPVTTENAQREAMIDWGAVNGVPNGGVRKQDDHLYTVEDLNTLVTTFNTRKSELAVASDNLGEDMPSRKSMALAVLKERFPELEDIYEKKLLDNVTRPVKNTYGGTEYSSVADGPHSLLDIAMMDLPGSDLRYYSDDKRIPWKKMNENPSFGVRQEFERQFKEFIENKKSAVKTSIKHLISQLPAQDRMNFELGKVSFYQRHNWKKGVSFFDTIDQPKDQALMVKIERGTGTTTYSIHLNTGRIVTVPNDQTKPNRRTRTADVSETKEFTPAGGQALRKAKETPSSGLPDDTFSSSRIELIANAFVEHSNFDDERIREYARGMTKSDEDRARNKALGEFLLNMIPLRSAIQHFRGGNIGDGVMDLAMDIFGFITVGAATAGKVAKIVSTAATRLSKGLRAVKAIGMATFSTLNPLDGLGDLAVGAARLVGKGIAKGTKAVKTVRGTAGNYDVLKAANKEHGITLVGTYKVAGRDVDTVAVLKNNQWYHYDPLKNKPFGAPIRGFEPKSSSLLTIPGRGPYDSLLKTKLAHAEAANLQQYELGLNGGVPLHSIPGYKPDMNYDTLKFLVTSSNLEPAQIGALVHEIRRQMIDHAKYVSKVLFIDVDAPSVRFTPVSQIDYLARVNIPSYGECAALSNLMATAVLAGKEDNLMNNIYRAARNPGDLKASKFIQEMENLQRVVGTHDTFHMGKPRKNQIAQTIITDLTNAPAPTVIRIATKDHAMTAGIKMNKGNLEWFFYDPNVGMVKFDTLQSMQEGMEKALNSGGHAQTLKPFVDDNGSKYFEVSEFAPSDMDKVNHVYKELVDADL